MVYMYSCSLQAERKAVNKYYPPEWRPEMVSKSCSWLSLCFASFSSEMYRSRCVCVCVPVCDVVVVLKVWNSGKTIYIFMTRSNVFVYLQLDFTVHFQCSTPLLGEGFLQVSFICSISILPHTCRAPSTSIATLTRCETEPESCMKVLWSSGKSATCMPCISTHFRPTLPSCDKWQLIYFK